MLKRLVTTSMRTHSLYVLLAALLCMAGCEARVDEFPSNQVFAERFVLSEGIEMEQAVEDSSTILRDLFGTPDEPRWPDFLNAAIVDPQRLMRAAGQTRSDEQGVHYGLYREHCVVCHGVAGGGMGPAAALLNPYPRDFRHGRFKFKSTELGDKPTREDLMAILEHGIAGTSMPSFRLVDEEDLDCLVDYVIYLSVRGELERRLLALAGLELDGEGGERLYDPRLENVDPKAFAESRELVEKQATEIAQQWEQAEPTEVKVPTDFPFVGSDAAEEEISKSVAAGKALFQGNVAACGFCHGSEGKGDGQQNNYDEWTRDWTVMAGLNPKEKAELKPMLDLGALKPRQISPRNLQLGAFRGGNDPEDLYRRIVNGIEGTPMPAAPLKPANPQGLSETEVWQLVNYLLSFNHEQSVEPTSQDGSEAVSKEVVTK